MVYDMKTFEKEALPQQLSAMSTIGRIAFATTCSQRLLPLFIRYCQPAFQWRQPLMEEALARLWAFLQGGNTRLPSVKR